jgi:hypothetical protein
MMSTEEILNDITRIEAEYERIYREKREKSKTYSQMLNERYADRVGKKIDWTDSYECPYPGGFFGGFDVCVYTMGDGWSVVPILYKPRKDGTASNRKYIVEPSAIYKVINLLNGLDNQ